MNWELQELRLGFLVNALPAGPANNAGRKTRSPTKAAVSRVTISQAKWTTGMKALSEKTTRAELQIMVVWIMASAHRRKA